MHDKRCLAAAIIAAVENLRDNEGITDLTFRVAMQDNEALAEADGYLADFTIGCACGYRVAHAYANDLRAIAKEADDRGDYQYADRLRQRAAHAEATRTVDGQTRTV